jgi:N-terminal acetyltransferase B complex catalytic subunit
MSLIRPFSALDLFEFNSINLDVWTETYGVNYYLSYLNHWGDLFSCVYFPSPPCFRARVAD